MPTPTPSLGHPGAAAPISESALSAQLFQRGVDAAMERMALEMRAVVPSGSPDADFLALMAPHHAAAVEMARLVLVHGRDPPTRQIAEEIIATQQVEIEGMRRRLALLRGAPGGGSVEFPALGGTRGSAEPPVPAKGDPPSPTREGRPGAAPNG